jgi:hypothetical protein
MVMDGGGWHGLLASRASTSTGCPPEARSHDKQPVPPCAPLQRARYCCLLGVAHGALRHPETDENGHSRGGCATCSSCIDDGLDSLRSSRLRGMMNGEAQIPDFRSQRAVWDVDEGEDGWGR